MTDFNSTGGDETNLMVLEIDGRNEFGGDYQKMENGDTSPSSNSSCCGSCIDTAKKICLTIVWFIRVLDPGLDLK